MLTVLQQVERIARSPRRARAVTSDGRRIVVEGRRRVMLSAVVLHLSSRREIRDYDDKRRYFAGQADRVQGTCPLNRRFD